MGLGQQTQRTAMPLVQTERRAGKVRGAAGAKRFSVRPRDLKICAILVALPLCLPHAAAAASDESGHWASDPKTHCALFDATLHPGDTVNWIGECRNGLGEGPGTASFFNGGKEFESFTGDFAGGVAQDGHVIVRWGDGWSYEGAMAGGHFEGQGVLIDDKKNRFEGVWKDGKLNGPGSVTHENGERYEGEWKDGLPNGHGILMRADGSRLEGQFLDGRFNGSARLSPDRDFGASDIAFNRKDSR
jgi:hypothetical protein